MKSAISNVLIKLNVAIFYKKNLFTSYDNSAADNFENIKSNKLKLSIIKRTIIDYSEHCGKISHCSL